jgi:lysophospholipase L1-like esterase
LYHKRDYSIWGCDTFFSIGLLSNERVEAFGDSITYGAGCGGAAQSPCDFFTGAFNALPVAAPNTSRVISNYAITGEHQSVSWPKAQAHIPLDKPRFAMWSAWSQNDGTSASAIQTIFNTYVQAFIDLCHANGVIPVIITSIPTSNIANSTDDNARLSVNSQALALASDTVIVADVNLIGNGASPARIAATYDADTVHPNTAGAAIMRTALQNAVQAWITAHP